jgi:hypothetical protein
MAAVPNRQTSQQQHRRETILYLIVPMIGVGMIVLGGGAIALLLPRRAQVSILSDWMLIVMVLCPAVLCLFGVCIALIVAVAGMNRLHDAATKPLDRLETLSTTLTEKTTQATDAVAQQTVNVSARFAFIDRLLNMFDELPENEEEKHD